MPRMELNDFCILLVLSSLNDPVDLVRAAIVSQRWRRLVIEHRLCKKLFKERFPGIDHVAYEALTGYRILSLSDFINGDAYKWGDLEKEHIIYSYLLQPQSKLMDCPWSCLLIPVGASSTRCIAENILTNTTRDLRYPVGYKFLANEGKSETRIDFLQCLESDVCLSIMSFLDDPADLVRVSAVSRFWHQFVIANGLAKKWCLKLLPHLSAIAGVDTEAETSTTLMKEGIIEREHRVYTSLLRAVTKSKVFRRDLIHFAVSASSTDKFPEESIRQTVHYRPPQILRPAYWSSKGHSNPEVPETLIYKLRLGPWLITEIDIQPYKAFEYKMPVYSARSVRFRIGHPKSGYEISSNCEYVPLPKGADDNFVWTYTSPEFPMTQANVLQRFKLPEPVICLGGYVQIELLGRVQRRESDGLFYLCVNHVKIVGRRLYPAFQTEIKEESGEMWLRYYPEFLCTIMQRTFSNDLEVDVSGKKLPHQHQGRFRYAKRLLGQYDPHTRSFH